VPDKSGDSPAAMAPRGSSSSTKSFDGGISYGFGPAGKALQRRQARGSTNAFEEIGRTGLRQWGGYVIEEWLTELQGRRGAETYREMQDNDPVIGGILYLVEMLVRGVTWWFEPATNSNQDMLGKQFCEECFFDDMSTSWADLVSEIMSMLPFGYSYFETVYKRRGGDVRDPSRRSKFTDGKITLRKLAIRSQDALLHWDFDDYDNVTAMVQQPPPHYATYTIPIEKALLFRTKVVKNNPEGRSILRNAVRPYYFLKNIQNIEGIGVERDLAGLPTLKPPPDVDIWNTEDPKMAQLLQQAQQFVSQVRRDELEGVVVPNGWEFELLKGGGSRAFNTNDIITRYEQRIATSLVGDVVLMGQDKVGSYALAGVKKALLSSSIEVFLDQIASVLNTYQTPRLFKLNGIDAPDGYPKLCHGPVEDIDLETIAQLLTAMGAAGAPVFAGDAEDKLLNALLERMGLPSETADDTSDGE
jgi:hypothetical protein